MEKPMTGILVGSTTMEVEKVFKGKLQVGDKIVFGQGNGIGCTGCSTRKILVKSICLVSTASDKSQAQ